MVILAEGGLTTPWPKIRPVMRMGLSLATIGVAVSVAIMAVAGHYLLGLSWEVAVLLGAVTSPTDAAAVFSVLRRVPLPSRLIGSLEAESGLNDAPTVVLVTLISMGGHHGFLGVPGHRGRRARARRRDGSGGRLRRCLADAPGGAAGVRSLPARRDVAGGPRLRRHRRAARLRLRRGVRRRAGAGQRRPAAPGRDAVVLRGSRVAGPDRAVRDARTAGVTGPDRPGHRRAGDRRRAGAHVRGAAGLGAGQLAGAADALARARVPVLGRAARSGADRARDDPAGRGGGGRRSGCSTSCSCSS